MRRYAALLTALVQLAVAPQARVAFAMKTGILLRTHVVAADNTPAMQQVKYVVRDAVCDVYEQLADPDQTMFANVRHHLDALCEAAVSAARDAGFTGDVAVSLETADFPARLMDGLTITAGTYPALFIRLGEAQGRNWWGLIDRDLALRCAAISTGDGAIVWDWSWSGFLQALGQLFPAMEGV